MKRYKIQVVPEVQMDLKKARDWYRGKNPQLPKRFTEQIKITLERVRHTPTAHAVRYKDVRIANISIFPYAVHYIIKSETIIVLAVHHTANDPAKWLDRLR